MKRGKGNAFTEFFLTIGHADIFNEMNSCRIVNLKGNLTFNCEKCDLGIRISCLGHFGEAEKTSFARPPFAIFSLQNHVGPRLRRCHPRCSNNFVLHVGMYLVMSPCFKYAGRTGHYGHGQLRVG